MTIKQSVVVPMEIMEAIDAAIKFYASYETYMPPRISGVTGGCQRAGEPPIEMDWGRGASAVLQDLIRLYPLSRVKASEAERALLDASKEARALYHAGYHWVKRSLAIRVVRDLAAQLQQEHDIRIDREATISLVAESLGVEPEPHQTFFERLIEAASRDAVQPAELTLSAMAMENATTIHDALMRAMRDHYWDSLEPQKELVLKHIEGALRWFRMNNVDSK